MKLQTRLTLPLVIISLLTTFLAGAGVMLLIHFTFNGIFQSQGATIGNIAMTVLESRTYRMNQSARKLLDSPGSFLKNASLARMADRLDFAAEVSGRRAVMAYGAAPDNTCIVALSGMAAPHLLIIKSGNTLLLAGSASSEKSGRTVVVGQAIDQEFISALRKLLLMDLSLAYCGISLSSTGPDMASRPDIVPSSISFPGPCGAATLTMLVPAGPALATLRKSLILSLGLFILVLLASWLIYRILVWRVARPIIDLNAAVEQVASGDFDTRIVIHGPDELGTLVKRFNEMVASLKTAQERLVRSAKLASVGEMVAGISHELNNPLSGLIGQAEYLFAKTAPDSPGKEELEIILSEARRMKQTLAQLRGLIKPADAEKSQVDLNHIIQDVALLLKHDASRSGITFVQNASKPRIIVRGVPDQLRQVILNLALNSIQAMSSGGRITVETDLIMRNGQKSAMIRFTDTGPGIPPAQAERIFEPFYSGKSGNLGLGLAICREIISRHGGTIEADSGVEHGSAFTIHIPAGIPE